MCAYLFTWNHLLHYSHNTFPYFQLIGCNTSKLTDCELKLSEALKHAVDQMRSFNRIKAMQSMKKVNRSKSQRSVIHLFHLAKLLLSLLLPCEPEIAAGFISWW